MKLFKQHPETVGETYTEHMGTAFSFGWNMIFSGLACVIHGIFPFLFENTGSKKITELHERMVTHRCKKDAPVAPTSGVSRFEKQTG